MSEQPHSHDGHEHTHDGQPQQEELTPAERKAQRIIDRLRNEVTAVNEARISRDIDLEEANEAIAALVKANTDLANVNRALREQVVSLGGDPDAALTTGPATEAVEDAVGAEA